MAHNHNVGYSMGHRLAIDTSRKNKKISLLEKQFGSSQSQNRSPSSSGSSGELIKGGVDRANDPLRKRDRVAAYLHLRHRFFNSKSSITAPTSNNHVKERQRIVSLEKTQSRERSFGDQVTTSVHADEQPYEDVRNSRDTTAINSTSTESKAVESTKQDGEVNQIPCKEARLWYCDFLPPLRVSGWFKLPTQSVPVTPKTLEDVPATVEGDRKDDSTKEQDDTYASNRNIPESKLRQIARLHLCATEGDRCWVLDRKSGSFNCAYAIQFDNGTKYVLRVPDCGRKAFWNEAEAFNLRSQALTMNYLRRVTGLPIPEVFAYSNTCENLLGRPFILMEHLPGKPICDVWEPDHEGDLPAVEEMRMRILKNLAVTMSRFAPFTFSMCGLLYFDTDADAVPYVGPIPQILKEDEDGNEVITWRPAYQDTHAALKDKLEIWFEDCSQPMYEPFTITTRASKVILDIIVDCFPFRGCGDPPARTNTIRLVRHERPGDENREPISVEPRAQKEGEACRKEIETFCIAPPDFNWQNILVDKEGNITGLLDWDEVGTRCRVRGWACLPYFLSHDYAYNYQREGGSDIDDEHDYERYRKAYANFMSEICEGKGDCRFTGKSHLWYRICQALDGPHEITQILKIILTQIMPRTRMDEFFLRIGKEGGGFRVGEEEWLRGKLADFFECIPGADGRYSF
ncbi:hypothetical protein EJ08DRAFT_335465 [Tothia fuscella]|uniref:Aminoglycoside phosphotransferase domain-containing protein n=1 Tax=Tothia fuscella TaxID=1048955 RepID=A0A9P4P138_9PEZI|nr:hypothetical protein EJ08DRAFT_335465 [Tothia fuscella]